MRGKGIALFYLWDKFLLLFLMDAEHVVPAEGFTVGELDEKLNQVTGE